jgi:hypothetical protein
MRWIVPTTYGGHARVSPCHQGEAVQIELFGSRGGFLAGMAFDTVAFAPQLRHSIDRAIAEAEELWEARELPDFDVPDLSLVPDLGAH